MLNEARSRPGGPEDISQWRVFAALRLLSLDVKCERIARSLMGGRRLSVESLAKQIGSARSEVQNALAAMLAHNLVICDEITVFPDGVLHFFRLDASGWRDLAAGMSDLAAAIGGRP